MAPPRRSADRVRVLGSGVQEVRSDDSVLLCVEGQTFGGGVTGGRRRRCEGHKSENESLEVVSH